MWDTVISTIRVLKHAVLQTVLRKLNKVSVINHVLLPRVARPLQMVALQVTVPFASAKNQAGLISDYHTG